MTYPRFLKHAVVRIRRAVIGTPYLLFVGLILLVGTTVSVALFATMRRWEANDQAAQFSYAAIHPIEAMRRATERLTLANEAVRQYCYGAPQLTHDGFVLAAAPFMPHVPSIRAMLWAPRVTQAERKQLDTAKNGIAESELQIYERDVDKHLTPAGERKEYYPIRYVISPYSDPVNVGFNLESHPGLRKAMAQSRDSDSLVITKQLKFASVANGEPVILTFLPVYHNPQDIYTLEDRRREIRGYLVSVCRVSVMVENALSYETNPRGIDFWLIDTKATTDRKILYYHASRTRPGDSQDAPVLPQHFEGIHDTGTIDFGGRSWSMACVPAAGFFPADAAWRSWGLLIGGMALTLLFASYVISVATRRDRVERLVKRRTRDIQRLDDELRKSQETKAAAIRQAHEETIHRLVAASLYRDEETGMHIKRTGLLSEHLALAAGWSKADAEILRLAAPMHDVGKIGIPDSVLRKPGKLSATEYEIMKTHTVIGARMLEGSQSAILAMARVIALCHHERWDGTGYPNGLSGLAIPEAARILSIVDVFDALSHDRVYRPVFPDDEVLNMMSQGTGSQFDPSLMAVFFAHYEELRQLAQENPDNQANDANLDSLSLLPTNASPLVSLDTDLAAMPVPPITISE